MSRITSGKALAAAAMALATLTACVGDGPAFVAEYGTNYDYNTFNLYHRNRDTLVVIHGNPLGMDEAAFATAVTDAMQTRNSAIHTHFTTKSGGSTENNLRVVLAFNKQPGNAGLCEGTPTRDIPTPGKSITQVYGAWCWSDRPEMEVIAYVSPITSVSDPRFLKLVADATRELFPGPKDFQTESGSDKSTQVP